MTDLTPWIGLPYREGGRGPDSYDCLGLFVALHRARTGLVIPIPGSPVSAAGRRATFEAARAFPEVREVPPEQAREGDGVLFRMPGGLHIGYALDRRDMLHLPDGATRSCIERWDAGRWRDRMVGVWRYG